jgi:hypothetical protein
MHATHNDAAPIFSSTRRHAALAIDVIGSCYIKADQSMEAAFSQRASETCAHLILDRYFGKSNYTHPIGIKLS